MCRPLLLQDLYTQVYEHEGPVTNLLNLRDESKRNKYVLGLLGTECPYNNHTSIDIFTWTEVTNY